MREFSPEEVTANIYTMVDVLLHNIQVEHQHGHLLQVQALFLKSFLKVVWKEEESNLVLALYNRKLFPLRKHFYGSI